MLMTLNLIGSLLCAFAACYLAQQWLGDRNTPPILIELHRLIFLVLTCLFIWHGVEPSTGSTVAIVWCVAALWIVRIVSRVAYGDRVSGTQRQ